jgi:transposase
MARDALSPEPRRRLRCAQCGNLTRFDVVETRRTRAFWHYSLGGDLAIEEEEVLSAERERVTCRWCGSTQIEEIEAT